MTPAQTGSGVSTMGPTIMDIKQISAAHFGIPVKDLESASRSKKLTLMRQITMAAAKRLTAKSLPEIGRKFGDRDHTTVLHAVRKIEKLVGSDPSITADFESIVFLVGEPLPDEDHIDDRVCEVAGRIAAITVEIISRHLERIDPAPVVVPVSPARKPDTASELLAAVAELESSRFSQGEKYAIERVITAGRKAREAKGFA